MAEKSRGDASLLVRHARRQISIKDIARLAHVSHPTVSRALKDSPLVNAETAARIRKIADEAGYRASAVARGLVTRRTLSIGLVTTTVADPFAGEVICGVEQTANDHGYSVMLAESNTDPEREKKVVQSLAERRVDGIIVTSSRVGTLYIPLLREATVPVVLVNDQYPGVFLHSVLIDNVNGMRAAAEHLIGLGHRRIAYVGDEFGYQSDAERLAGYTAALEAAGLKVNPRMLSPGNGRLEGAAKAVKKLLALRPRPTAICCYNDMTALGAMRAIREHGLRIPEDISVTGFDDLFFAAYTQPPLTTVHQPMRRMGQMAVESLLKLMAGQAPVPRIRIKAELVARGSTARVKKAGNRD